MKIYTINKHWRVVETVEVVADTEEEALELAKQKSTDNVEYIEITDMCVTDINVMSSPLEDITEEASDYLEELLEDIEFENDVVADYQSSYDDDGRMHTVTVQGAYYEQYEIQCCYLSDDRSRIDTRSLSDFTEADQYRICEEILRHRDNNK